jgi:hypothetical protein
MGILGQCDRYVRGQRVMGQVNWPLGVDNIFSFTGDEYYLATQLRTVDLLLIERT